MTAPSRHRSASYAVVALVAAGAVAAAAAPGSAAPVSTVQGYQSVQTGYSAGPARQTTESATCPAGTVAVSGGVVFPQGTPSSVVIVSSRPSADGRQWVETVGNPVSVALDNTVTAVCIEKPAGYTVVTGTAVTNPAQAQTIASASCPAKTVAFGGGGTASSGSAAAVGLADTFPISKGTGWQVSENNTSTGADTIQAVVVCGKKPSKYKVRVGAGHAVASMSTDTDVVDCGLGAVPLGGGADAGPTSTAIGLFQTNPSQDRFWAAGASNRTGAAGAVTAYAVCAKG